MDRELLVNKYKELCQRVDIGKRNILRELDSINGLDIKDNIAIGSNLCIILSCPGEYELIEQSVCVGQTGKNLECILRKVFSTFELIKPGQSTNSVSKYPDEGFRYNYTIVNASSKVHFRKFNGAEPDDSSIRDSKNIDRVMKALSGENIEYFLICGDKAKILFDEIQDSYIGMHYSEICHIGNVGIRNAYTKSFKLPDKSTIGDLPEDQRDDKRMSLISSKIVLDWETD